MCLLVSWNGAAAESLTLGKWRRCSRQLPMQPGWKRHTPQQSLSEDCSRLGLLPELSPPYTSNSPLSIAAGMTNRPPECHLSDRASQSLYFQIFPLSVNDNTVTLLTEEPFPFCLLLDSCSSSGSLASPTLNGQLWPVHFNPPPRLPHQSGSLSIPACS